MLVITHLVVGTYPIVSAPLPEINSIIGLYGFPLAQENIF